MNANFGFGEPATAPDELNGPLPRTARMTGNGISMAIFTVIFALLGAAGLGWLGWKGEQLTEHRDALRRGGIEVSGHATRVWSSGKSNSTHHVAYTFEANGAEYSGESHVPTAAWRTLWAARPITIRYLPANPDINHPADWEETDSAAWLPLFAPGMFLVPSIVFLYRLRLERKLILSGLPAIATVRRCSRRKNGWSIGFEFLTQTGIEASGGGWSATARENGEQVCILYLPENPRISQPYPFQNYRLGE
jgi:hypothetical protein